MVSPLWSATTYTPNMGLAKQDDHDLGWGEVIRDNYDIIDASAATYPIRLSSGVTGILPSENMVSTAVFTDKQNVFTDVNNFQAISASSASINGPLNVTNLTANQCVQTSAGGLLTTSGASCGGSGGASALAVNQNGVQVTSPTVALNGLSPPFLITAVGAGTTAQWTLDPSSVTLRGINVINLQSSLQSGATFFVSSGTVSGQITTNKIVASTLSVTGNGTIDVLRVTGASGLTVDNLTSGQCVQAGTGGLLTVTGSSCGVGSGGASSLGVTTGTSTGFSSLASSPTAIINFDSSTFKAFLQGTATAYISLNPSSATLLGPSINLGSGSTEITGTLQAGSGGTGTSSTTDLGFLIGNSVSSWSNTSAIQNCTGSNKAVTFDTTTLNWGCNTITGGGLPLPAGATNYIQNTEILQSGATFYVSSGTIGSGNFYINSDPSLAGAPFPSTGTIILNTPSQSTTAGSLNYNVQTGTILPNFSLIVSSGAVSAGNSLNLQLKGSGSISGCTQGLIWGGTCLSQSNGISTFGTVRLSSMTNTGKENLTGDLAISSGVLLSGSAGNNGQVLTSGGAGTIPTWTTPSSGGASTLAIATGTSAGFSVPSTSPTAVINLDSAYFSSSLTGAATAFITIPTFATIATSTASLQTQITAVGVSTGSLQAQVTALGVSTGAIAADTGTFITASSVTATYLQQSSATVTYLQLSSATATYSQTNHTHTGSTLSGIDISDDTNLAATNGVVLTGDSVSVSSVSLSSQAVGTLPIANGGTGTGTTLTGLVRGSASAFTAAEISGDGTTSGSNALTLAASQGNIKTFTSSITVTNASGLNTIYGAILGSATVNNVIASLPAQFDSNKQLVSNLLSLTTAVTGILPAGNMVSTAAFTGSTQTWTAQQTYNNTVVISTTIGLGGLGTTGTAGQFLTSQGPTSIPTWTTSSGGGGIVSPGTFTWTNNFGISGSTLSFSTGTFTYVSGSTISYSSSTFVLASVSTITVTSSATIRNVDNLSFRDSHVSSTGTAPSLSSCGTGPVITGSDLAFTITGGTGSNGCTATFAKAYGMAPTCTVSQQTMSLVNSLSYTVSTTALTITQTGLGTNKLDIMCIGHD